MGIGGLLLVCFVRERQLFAGPAGAAKVEQLFSALVNGIQSKSFVKQVWVLQASADCLILLCQKQGSVFLCCAYKRIALKAGVVATSVH